MEGEEAGSIAPRSFLHPTFSQERRDHPPTGFLVLLHGLALGTSVASVSWFHIARQSPACFPQILWGSPQDHSSVSRVLCFSSLLGRLRASHLLKSQVDTINLTLNHQLPTGSFQILIPSGFSSPVASNTAPIPRGRIRAKQALVSSVSACEKFSFKDFSFFFFS